MGFSTTLGSTDLSFPLSFPLSFRVGPPFHPYKTSSRHTSLPLVLGLSQPATPNNPGCSEAAPALISAHPHRLFLLPGALFPRVAWHLLPTLPDSAQAPPASVKPEPTAADAQPTFVGPSGTVCSAHPLLSTSPWLCPHSVL